MLVLSPPVTPLGVQDGEVPVVVFELLQERLLRVGSIFSAHRGESE
jgi:hypothetical protein